MPHTLVTGANGFVAVHVVSACINAGHMVTGSVRTKAKGEELLEIHPEWKGKLDFVEIEDYATEGAWDDTFKSADFDYVMHVAAPMVDEPKSTDYERDFLRPGVEGNKQLLQSAHKYGTNVKAIAVTGSINSITTGEPQDLKSRVLTNDAWNFITKEQAIESNNAYIRYCASKKEGEKAIWEFMEKTEPKFTVTVFLPPLVFGPPLQRVKTMKHMNFSNDQVYGLFNGSNAVVPGTVFPAYIDVRDLAEAHLKALTAEKAANKRFLVGSPISFPQIVDTLRGLPDLEGRLPKGSDETPTFPRMEVEPTNMALSLNYRTMQETFFDQAKKILQLEKELGL